MSEVPAESEDRDQMLKELQSYWEIASIAQFISLFRESFNLPEIEIEELEEWFIDNEINGSSKGLHDLIVALLRTILTGRVNEENWESQLQKVVHRKWPKDKENPFPEGVTFSELHLRAKVEILYDLCHYRFDRHDIETIMKSMDAEALRVQKLGMDDIGNTYWYFYGTRLYKEEYTTKKSWDVEWQDQKTKTFKKRGRGRPRKYELKSDGESDDHEDMVSRRNSGYMNANEKSRWSVVCDTMEEWVLFAEKFQSSKSKNEKALFQVIQENFLPTLSKIYEEKEKKLQQKIRELMPVRERIVTRRETRRQRGEFQQSSMNGYSISDEAHKLHMQKDRARRLEERNRRASEIISYEEQKCKRARYDKYASEESMLDAQADEYKKVAFSKPDSSITTKTDTQPQSNTEMQLDLQTQMERLLSDVKLHKDAWPFLFPVREEQAPGYLEIIKEPMDLSLIESKLYDGQYETVGELDADFSKMVANCELYNGENHVYSKMAHTLWKAFRRGVSKILDSLPEEFLNSEAQESAPTGSSSNSSSPSVTQAPNIHSKKSKHIKKKRRHGMDPLEMLAHASEIAVQTSNSGDMQSNSDAYETNMSFSTLKVTSINSHPPSLIEKFSSDSSSEGSDGSGTSDSNSSYTSEENVDEAGSSPSETNYTNNLPQHFSNFIEKSSDKDLSVLTSSEMMDVATSSAVGKNNLLQGNITSYSKELIENTENIDHGLDNILEEECNENVSNFISSFMKQPVYSSDNQVMQADNQMNENNVTSEYLGNISKQGGDVTKIRKSPTSHYLGQNTIDNNVSLFQDGLSMSSTANTSTITTVDSSSIGILYNNPRVANMPASHGNSNARAKLSPTEGNNITIGPPRPTFSYRAQLESHQNQPYKPSNNSVPKKMDVPFQPLHVDIQKTANKNPSTYVASTISQSSYVVPSAHTTTVELPQLQAQPLESRMVKLNVPNVNTPTARVMLVPEAPGGSGITTYHLYAESKPEGAVPGNPSVLPSGSSSNLNVPGSIIINSQDKSLNQGTPPQNRVTPNFATPPQKMSPGLLQGSHMSSNSPSSQPMSFNSPRSAIPATTSAFVPLNSATVGTEQNKLSVFQNKGLEASLPQSIQNTSYPASTGNNSYSTSSVNSYFTSPLNSIPNGQYQNNNGINTFPKSIHYQNFNQPQTPNVVNTKTVTVNSGMAVHNGMPIVQQVLIPGGAQQIQLPNGTQYIITGPASTNVLGNKTQVLQVQNNIRQDSQPFGKVIPQVVNQGQVLHITKDNIIPSYQLQAATQNSGHQLSQVQNTQYTMNIPTYMLANPNVHQASVHAVSMQPYQVPQRPGTH